MAGCDAPLNPEFDDQSVELCPYCGGEAMLEIVEIFEGRQFLLDACCEAAHQEAVDELQDPECGRDLLRRLEVEALMGEKLRRVCDIGANLQLDWQLRLVPVSLREARAFVARHHNHCPPPAGWRFGHGVRNGHELIGVVMVGRPVARLIDNTTTVEINRLCVRRDGACEFRWNAASMLLGWAAREARKRKFERAVTYTLDTEPGTTLRAAGWRLDGITRGGRWSTASRPRADAGPLGPKQRWVLDLRTPRIARASVRPVP